MSAAGEVRVSGDGSVTRDGQPIGRVERVVRDGLYATATGASVSGKPWWIPYAADGTCLTEVGYDTRKRAVARVAAHSAPLTVSDVGTETASRGGFGGYRQVATATVSFRGYTFCVSRYADETAWVIDALFNPASFMPVFSHGTGSRCTRLQVLAGEADTAATTAAIAAGVWPIADTAQAAPKEGM